MLAPRQLTYEYVRIPTWMIPDEQLEQFLQPHGYLPCPVTPGLWKDSNSDLMFTLVVDNFGICYNHCSDIERFLATLRSKYGLTMDWTGAQYIGITISWDYLKHTVDLTMPGYISLALQLFQHPTPSRPQHSPHAWTPPAYGAHQQFVLPDVNPVFDLLDKKASKRSLAHYYTMHMPLTAPCYLPC